MWIKNSFVSLAVIVFLCISGWPVLADDTSNDAKAISLDINWIDDTISERPESMTIELIRTVDDTVTPMDSKTLSKSSFGSKNTWSTTFSYLYGEVWEYSFKVTQVIPETALYQYQFIETGNGTDKYTFDYIYGQGETEMTIVTHFENIDSSERPDSLNIDVFSFTDNEEGQEDSEQAERSILTKGDGDTWVARVSGLSDNPDNYFIVVTDLSNKFTSTVTKGDSPNIYVNTITPNTAVSKTGVSTSMSENVKGVITAITPVEINSYSGVLHNLFLNFGLLLLIGITSALAVLKHRRIIRERRKRK